MQREFIRGLDDITHGDIICHIHDEKVREYRVESISEGMVRLSMKRYEEQQWQRCGNFNENSSVFGGQMYVKTSWETPYDPTQAGDKEDDI